MVGCCAPGVLLLRVLSCTGCLLQGMSSQQTGSHGCRGTRTPPRTPTPPSRAGSAGAMVCSAGVRLLGLMPMQEVVNNQCSMLPSAMFWEPCPAGCLSLEAAQTLVSILRQGFGRAERRRDRHPSQAGSSGGESLEGYFDDRWENPSSRPR